MKENNKQNMQKPEKNELLEPLKKMNLMDDFLHYVENSNAAGISEDCDERLVHLHTIVEQIKASEQMGVTYMKMQERDRQIREDGRKEGRKEGENAKLLSQVQKKLKKGKTVEEIAEDLEEEISVINRLVKHLKEEG